MRNKENPPIDKKKSCMTTPPSPPGVWWLLLGMTKTMPRTTKAPGAQRGPVPSAEMRRKQLHLDSPVPFPHLPNVFCQGSALPAPRKCFMEIKSEVIRASSSSVSGSVCEEGRQGRSQNHRIFKRSLTYLQCM